MEEYRREKYYVERYKSKNEYADMLVVKIDGYWRTLFMTGDADGRALDRCKDWISNRRCFN